MRTGSRLFAKFLRLVSKTMLGLAIAIPATSIAGMSSSPIQQILLWDQGTLVYVYPSGGFQNAPGCHTAGYYTFSMSRPMAKEYLAALLAAQARGANVTIWGKGVCQDQNFAETLDYFRVDQ